MCINLKKQNNTVLSSGLLAAIIWVTVLCGFIVAWFSGCSLSVKNQKDDSYLAETQMAEIQSDFINSETEIDDYFVEVGRHGNYYFMYDKYTKVMYTQYYSLKGGTTSLTVMLKADGKPLTYDEWRNYQNQ